MYNSKNKQQILSYKADTAIEDIINFVNEQPDKQTFLHKKNIAFAASGVLIILAMLVFQTLNAFALVDKNAELEKKLAQYQSPAIPTLPEPYIARNVSLDFTQPFPEVSVSYLDNEEQACKSVKLEVPPSIQNAAISDKWPGYF